MDAPTAQLILGVASLLFTFLGVVFTGIMSYMMAKMAQGQKEVKKELEEVHKTANGLSEKLMEASKKEGSAVGAMEERDRAVKEQAAVDRGIAEEKARTVNGSSISQVNGTVAENVQVVKENVQEIGVDVKDVKAEVIKDIKTGVAEVIKESKAQREADNSENHKVGDKNG